MNEENMTGDMPENVEEEPVVETESAENAEETETEAPVEDPQPQSSDEMKIVLIIKADRALMAVGAPNCDPVYTTLTGTLEAALQAVPQLVEDAKVKWSTAPRNPKANLPEPPPRPATTRTTSTPAAKPTKQQPSFF